MFTFYSEVQFSEFQSLSTIASSVTEKARTSELYDPRIHHRFFIADKSWFYAFLNGPYRSAMSRNYELGNSIFVPTLDPANHEIVHFDGRRADAVKILTHEVMHSYVQNRIGLLRVWRLQWWQKEGYPEYIASDKGTRTDAPPAYREAAHAWKYLLEVRRLRFEEIIALKQDPHELMDTINVKDR